MSSDGIFGEAQSKENLTKSISSVAFAMQGEGAFDNAIDLSIVWMRGLNRSIPKDASKEQGFEIGGGGTPPARAVSLNSNGVKIWSATIDNPDKHVLGRTWITEITVAERSGEVHFGSRLLNVSRRNEDSFIPSIPRIVRDIIAHNNCYSDGIKLRDGVIYVESDEDFEWLINLLQSEHRRLPAIVMAEAVSMHPLLNLESFAKRLTGAAHIIGISNKQTWKLSRISGKNLNVFDGAVRLYWPGLNFEESDSYSHPLWLSSVSQNRAWSGASIIARVLSSGVSKGTTAYPRFEAVRQAAAEHALTRLRANSTDAEMVRLYEEENATLLRELKIMRGEQNQWLADAEEERSQAERQISELKYEIHRYRAQIDRLKTNIQSSGAIIESEPLTKYENFTGWVERNTSANLWISPRAIKEVERSGLYKSPDEVGEALRLLDEVYVPMKLELQQGGYSILREKLEALGMSISDCFSQSGDLRRFPEYSISYRGQTVWCDQHLKRGGGADPRSMFRIYFNWCKDRKVLVIGHMLSHLDNNMTN